MHEYVIEFFGMSVAVRYDQAEILDLLDFLFADLRGQSTGSVVTVLEIFKPQPERLYTITGAGSEPLFYGKQGTQFAAILFDQVIHSLLCTLKNGVALHTGAVSRQGMTILLPGKSGAGKSSVTAWLTANGFSYLTDELVFLPDDGSGRVIPFPRPLCIKTGSAAVIKKMLPEKRQGDIWEDAQGAVIPHRLLNHDFILSTASPALFLFPEYRNSSPLHTERISGARASALLMACDVNARNLIDHGFRQLAGLARSVPSLRITYSSFAEFSAVLLDLLPESARGNDK
jgi:hypothetical protein